MKKDELLKSIAETGYNVGFGAKKHFATYDIVEKIPGLIGFISTVFGVYGLVFEQISNKTLSATLIVLGIIGLCIFFYDSKKMEYEKTGKDLTKIFNDLRDLYRTVQGSQVDDMSTFEQSLKILESDYYSKSISKQILFSDWYAHYKFFWQHQIDWVDEQKKFQLFRDKIPLSLSITIAFLFVLLVYLSASQAIACLW